MKKTLLAVTMAALTIPLTSQAAESGLGIAGNFGFTSSYKYRGISQSADKVAAQGGFDLSHGSGLYLDWSRRARFFSLVESPPRATPKSHERETHIGGFELVGGLGDDRERQSKCR